jgi:pimeloyl-ACP methyl ester carboxylesterase
MRFIHSHTNLSYQDAGHGSPILLIHGYPLSSKMWQPQIEALSASFRVIAPDLRGFGASEAPPGPYPMDVLADDCAALLDHLEITQPVTVCGLSMGGYVSFAFWRKHPQRVSRLILAATRALPDAPEAAENRLKAAALAEKEGSEAIARAMLPKMLSPTTQAAHPELVAQVKAIMLEASVPGIVGALMGMRARPDSTPTLPTITVPTLIIRGDDDPFASIEENAAMQQAIPDARLVRIPNAAHLPNLEQPVLFDAAVRQFLMA